MMLAPRFAAPSVGFCVTDDYERQNTTRDSKVLQPAANASYPLGRRDTAMPTVAEREFRHAFANTTPPQSVAELRDMMDMLVPLLNQNAPEIGAFHEDVELRSGLRADIAVPKGGGPFPVVVYLHGGGWLAG